MADISRALRDNKSFIKYVHADGGASSWFVRFNFIASHSIQDCSESVKSRGNHYNLSCDFLMLFKASCDKKQKNDCQTNKIHISKMLNVAHLQNGASQKDVEENFLRPCLHSFGRARTVDKIFKTKDFPLPGNGIISAALSGRVASSQTARPLRVQYTARIFSSHPDNARAAMSALEEESSL